METALLEEKSRERDEGVVRELKRFEALLSGSEGGGVADGQGRGEGEDMGVPVARESFEDLRRGTDMTSKKLKEKTNKDDAVRI